MESKFDNIFKNLTAENIIKDSDGIIFKSNDVYLKSYPLLINNFQQIITIKSEHVVIGCHMV